MFLISADKSFVEGRGGSLGRTEKIIKKIFKKPLNFPRIYDII